MPSKHSQVMPKKCVACHLFRSEGDNKVAKEAKESSEEQPLRGGHTFRVDDRVCLKCHDNPESLAEDSRAKTEALLQRLKAILESSPDKKSSAYKTAKANYNLVVADGGIGLHNPGYAQALLKNSIALMAESVWKK